VFARRLFVGERRTMFEGIKHPASLTLCAALISSTGHAAGNFDFGRKAWRRAQSCNSDSNSGRRKFLNQKGL
jgi:hypothetical protein